MITTLRGLIVVALFGGTGVKGAVHYVDANNRAPAAPYSDWTTAASTIQDAIDASSNGDTVWVTNGLYASGGKVMAGDLTNRVAVNKAITVQSVNGADVTTIRGEWDPSTTNGPLAVRCAWVTNGAVLSGFTLERGATRSAGDQSSLMSGGGVWGSTNARVVDCVIQTNAAGYGGGGCYQAHAERCKVIGNISQSGGGGYQATLYDCAVVANTASQNGGGMYNGTAFNCTLTLNHAAGIGGGVQNSFTLYNSIVYNNSVGSFGSTLGANWNGPGHFYSSCTTPAGFGSDNIISDPQLLDTIHLAATSPCRGAGSTNYSSGLDIDGEAWADAPSMGCDEYVESGLTGPLQVRVSSIVPVAVVGKALLLYGQVTGRASRVEWSFGDGSSLTNASVLTLFHTWTNPGNYTVSFTAFNTDNPVGVSSNIVVQLQPLAHPTLSPAISTDGHFGVTFSSQYGVLYFVESATNLVPPVTWQSVTPASGNGTLSVYDFSAPSGMKYYRVRTQQ